jgi:uncharacterized repeat protein (TIGR03803 family)
MTRLNCLKTMSAVCLLFAAAIASQAQTFTTLAYFADGSNTYSSLIQGTDGNLYGTSNNGGTGSQGSVFEVTFSGTLTTLYSFCSQANCTDGSLPFSALALGTDGNFYGTTQNGGASGMGVAFKITPGGTYTVLHSFSGADGSGPDAGLALGTDGNFYGTTFAGGGGNLCVGSCGTVFKITSAGTLTTLHSFGQSDGANPSAPLIQGTDGAFYGTTYSGGNDIYSCSPGACGTVFKITSNGKFTSLHAFDFTDGAKPYAPLVQAANGAFYGTTFEGGDVGFEFCSIGCGTVFKISSGGTFSTVHKFYGTDGGGSYAGLVQATDGNLYGESSDKGIFKLALPAKLTTVYEAGGETAVLQATDGQFYGTFAASPGSYAIFSLNMGLGPFVALVIRSGKVGQTAEILGQGLTGTSRVTFNGVQATSFKVVSDTYMTAVVPIGATTGNVVVTTPTGTLTSNINFRIAK